MPTHFGLSFHGFTQQRDQPLAPSPSLSRCVTLVTMQWKLAPNSDLHWRSWDGEVVIFHPASGDTHILHPLAAEILSQLEVKTVDVEQLGAHVAQTFELQPSDELLRQLEQCVKQFADLGLVIPVESHE